MKFAKTLSSVFILLLVCQGCLSYKWSATAQLDNLSQETRELQTKKLQEECSANNGEYDSVNLTCKGVLIVTEASGDDRIGCYLSFWIYGGWCWFVSPNEADKDLANHVARQKLNSSVKVEYLGRR